MRTFSGPFPDTIDEQIVAAEKRRERAERQAPVADGRKPVAVTRDEWLKAVADCEPKSDELALTISELETLLGLSRAKLRARIPRWLAAGHVEKTMKRTIRGCWVSAYRLVKLA